MGNEPQKFPTASYNPNNPYDRELYSWDCYTGAWIPSDTIGLHRRISHTPIMVNTKTSPPAWSPYHKQK